jgi:hypothetical protein
MSTPTLSEAERSIPAGTAAANLPVASSQGTQPNAEPATPEGGSTPEAKARRPKGDRRLMRHLRQVQALLRQLSEEHGRTELDTGRLDTLFQQLKQDREELDQRAARWEAEREQAAARLAAWTAQCDARDSRLAEREHNLSEESARLSEANAALAGVSARLVAALEQQSADGPRETRQSILGNESPADLQPQLAELERDRQRLDDQRRSLEVERDELAAARQDFERQQAELDKQRANLEQQAGELQRERFDIRRREAEDYAAREQRPTTESPSQADGRSTLASGAGIQAKEPAEQPAVAGSSVKSGGVHRVELSSVALLRRLGAMPDFEDEQEPPAAAAPPAVQPAVVPHIAQPVIAEEPEEDDIAAYMQRLMARNGVSSGRPSEPQSIVPKPKAAAPRESVAEQPRPGFDKASEPGDMAPRSLPPELSANLSAMRELANANARMAIQTHARRKTASTTLGKAAFCLGGLAGTLIAIWLYIAGVQWAVYAAATTGILTLASLLENMRLAAKLWRWRRDLRDDQNAAADDEVGEPAPEASTEANQD